MDKIDEIENELKGHYWEGDPESPKKAGRTLMLDKRRRSLRTSLIFVSSLVAVSAISVSATWTILSNSRSASDKFGSGSTDEAISYVKKLGEHYYPSAIGIFPTLIMYMLISIILSTMMSKVFCGQSYGARYFGG